MPKRIARFIDLILSFTGMIDVSSDGFIDGIRVSMLISVGGSVHLTDDFPLLLDLEDLDFLPLFDSIS